MSMRASLDTKSKFGALAAAQGLTESALLALLVEKVLDTNKAIDVYPKADELCDARCASDRLTLRLRPGDRALADARAASRRMKTASYLSMLVRTHVRGAPVMPPTELDQLKCATAHLAAVGRQLRAMTAAHAAQPDAKAGAQDLLVDVGHAVEGVREAVAAVVRANLISWEAGHA